LIKLSPREQEVLMLYVRHGRLKPVAEALGVSISTVKAQKRAAMRKLEAGNSTEMTTTAIKRGLVNL
jgi:DNA-binding NarL/FixJ family response regulator